MYNEYIDIIEGDIIKRIPKGELTDDMTIYTPQTVENSIIKPVKTTERKVKKRKKACSKTPTIVKGNIRITANDSSHLINAIKFFKIMEKFDSKTTFRIDDSTIDAIKRFGSNKLTVQFNAISKDSYINDLRNFKTELESNLNMTNGVKFQKLKKDKITLEFDFAEANKENFCQDASVRVSITNRITTKLIKKEKQNFDFTTLNKRDLAQELDIEDPDEIKYKQKYSMFKL